IINNKIVSSSEIKKLIKNSCFQQAALLLGRYFTIEGRFIKGRGIGKTIEFPTINIDIKNKNTPLQPAVYACFVKHKNRMFKAAVFYGKSPTFNTPLSFEIHILDETNIDIDKNDIFTIIPIKKIRGIKNFSSPQALTNQIKKDIAKTEKILDSIDFSSLFYKV
ncbi:MAG TPA: riboflavin kinase, partial [bacterium]|nr:riboflavin kinase [bacterium]